MLNKMTNYTTQLERLKRHYENSLNTYDEISFLDLLHALRIWTEIKESIDAISDKKFRKVIFNKNLKTIFRGASYVYTYLYNGVTTSATATQEVSSRAIVSGPMEEIFSVGSIIMNHDNGDLTIAQFMTINRSLTSDEVSKFNHETKNTPTDLVSFSKYMESPAIYFNFSKINPKCITNENLIKRLANEYEASHASSYDTKFEVNNVFSAPVKILMNYKCSQLPLPYFVILHIAKTIITSLETKPQNSKPAH